MHHNRVAHYDIRSGAHTYSDRLRGSLRSDDTGDRALPDGAARLIRRRVASERLTVQHDRVHVVRLLDRREERARLREADVCEATQLHLAPRFPFGLGPNTQRPPLSPPSW